MLKYAKSPFQEVGPLSKITKRVLANAFEQLIQERTPKLHRRIRDFYDKYGYPVSKHIRSAWSADVVYIIMKPLEWFFLLTLYLCDTKPENRINSQYLPDMPCCK